MRLRARNRAAREAGTTLIEMLIVSSVLGVVLCSISMMGIASDHAYRTGTATSQLETQAVVTTERIVADLRTAVNDSLSPDPGAGVGASSIEYVQAIGLDAGDVVWSGLRRLAFEYEVGEVNDGIDNNGNGVSDEGRIVLTEDIGGAGERRRTLTHWVSEYLSGEEPNGVDDNGNGLIDEQGFVVERLGESLVIRLTLERGDAQGRTLTRTTRTSARLRN
jgi:hypothetical protein